MNTGESRFVERKTPTARFGGRHAMHAKADAGALEIVDAKHAAAVRGYCKQVAHALEKQCGVEFRGRILEIGAGGAWLSAELSKLPRVVEIVATDFDPKALRDHAPEVFKLLEARAKKITRVPTEAHHLDFPAGHFDFVICVGALRHGLNVPQLLRECRRVLKPGGSVVAVCEPVQPLHATAAEGRRTEKETGADVHSVESCKEFFTRAGLDAHVHRLKVTGRLRYYYDKLVKGVIHARHAIVGTKRAKA